MAIHFLLDSVYSIHFTSTDIEMLFAVQKSSPWLAFTVSLCSRHHEALHRACLLVSFDLHNPPVWQEPLTFDGSK